MSPLPAFIAEIRADRQLEVRGPGRSVTWSTNPTDSLLWAAWSTTADDGDRAMHSWPTWSPDGSQIACFRTPSKGFGPELVVMGNGGVQTDVLVQFDEELPIYAQWSPDGGRVAVLFQEGARLGLWIITPGDRSTVEIGRGSPLFFTWADNDHVAVFHGRPNGSRIGLYDVRTGDFHPFPGTPGNFCAPVLLGDRIGYVAHHDGHLATWLANRSAARELEPVEGLAALLPSPTGTQLARAIAPDDRSEYLDLVRIDIATGHSELVDEGPITAFLWSPDETRMILARTDARSGIVSFSAMELQTGIDLHLGEVRPSRDLRFYLRFFEQFAQSHPLIDPDGEALVVAGELDRGGNADGLWRLPLDGSPPERLGDGLLGVWGPPG